jgi:hypothetical protein
MHDARDPREFSLAESAKEARWGAGDTWGAKTIARMLPIGPVGPQAGFSTP